MTLHALFKQFILQAIQIAKKHLMLVLLLKSLRKYMSLSYFLPIPSLPRYLLNSQLRAQVMCVCTTDKISLLLVNSYITELQYLEVCPTVYF
jgi:hypothetical protein